MKTLLYILFVLSLPRGVFSQLSHFPDSIPVLTIEGPRFFLSGPEADSSDFVILVKDTGEMEALQKKLYNVTDFPAINFEEYDLACITFCNGCRGWTLVNPYLSKSEDGLRYLVKTMSSGCFSHRCMSTGLIWLLISKNREPLPLYLLAEHDDIRFKN